MWYNDTYIYEEDILDNNLSNFVSCYQEPMKQEDFTSEMKNKYNEIEKYFASSKQKISFSYEDLYTGLHISYNEHQTYYIGLCSSDCHALNGTEKDHYKGGPQTNSAARL